MKKPRIAGPQCHTFSKISRLHCEKISDPDDIHGKAKEDQDAIIEPTDSVLLSPLPWLHITSADNRITHLTSPFGQ